MCDIREATMKNPKAVSYTHLAALGPARGAGGVVLCRVGKDRELVEKVHVLSGRISLCGAWAGRAGAACSSPWW